MFKSLLLTASALTACAVAAPAFAQDNDIWSGFYVGANVGAGWGDTSIDTKVGPGNGAIVIPPADVARINQPFSDDDNKTGFTGGVQGGFNYVTGSILLGIETDYGALDINQQRTNVYQSTIVPTPPIVGPAPAAPTYALDQRVETGWVWTVRPRIGYVNSQWLFYGTAGMAMTKVKLTTKYADTLATPGSGVIEDSDAKTGWTAGLGVGYMFTPSWSVNAEWLYADFGNVHDTVTTQNGFTTVTSEASVKANILRLGVNYKF